MPKILHLICHLLIFFKIYFFQEIFSGISWECQSVRKNILSSLIWVQAICTSYQQMIGRLNVKTCFTTIISFPIKQPILRRAPDKIEPILSSGKAGMLIQWIPGNSSEYPLDLDFWKMIFKLSLHIDNIWCFLSMEFAGRNHWLLIGWDERKFWA